MSNVTYDLWRPFTKIQVFLSSVASCRTASVNVTITLRITKLKYTEELDWY